jgi:cysteine desulfurase/selenocysteine lyase
MQSLNIIKINANIHRGVHTLTSWLDACKKFRGKIKITLMLNICSTFFTSGTTFGINLVTNGFASFEQEMKY